MNERALEWILVIIIVSILYLIGYISFKHDETKELRKELINTQRELIHQLQIKTNIKESHD